MLSQHYCDNMPFRVRGWILTRHIPTCKVSCGWGSPLLPTFIYQECATWYGLCPKPPKLQAGRSVWITWGHEIYQLTYSFQTETPGSTQTLMETNTRNLLGYKQWPAYKVNHLWANCYKHRDLNVSQIYRPLQSITAYSYRNIMVHINSSILDAP